MKKIAYIAPKKGGKTQFIIESIQNEYANGHKCYYLGGDRHYEEIVKKIKEQECKPELILISKDIIPSEDNCAVFTDNLTWEMTSIYPYALRAMIKLNCRWYYTLPQEEISNCEQSSEE